MLRKIAIVTIVSIALLSPKAYPEKSGADTDWYPFVLSENLDQNSPANIGKLVLDPPAGKHGFVKVKDGHFYFEDGARAKFWGTNLCFSACFPSKKQAKMMAERLAFFGFNAVRLHHMDFFFEPNGIFSDIRSGWKDPQRKKTGVLNPIQLDRLDYLIYQLKIRGIYVDMNLLVARHFTKADGVVGAEKLGMAAKPVSMFDSRLIALQKQYAKDLFTHYNPYTKSRYCDDPAIALAEITNENSIFDYWKWNRLNGSLSGFKKDSIPYYYTKKLDTKWNDWLKKKYGVVDRAKEARPIYKLRALYPPDRIKDIEAFYTNLEKEYFDGMTSFLKKDVGVKIPITGIGGSPTDRDIDAQESCDFIDKHAYWDHPGFPNSGWDRDDFRITNKSMLEDAGLGMAHVFKKISLSGKPRTLTEWNHCYPNQYAYEAPALMAYEAVKSGWDGLFQFAFKHMLPDPYKPDNIDSYFDIIANPQQLILMSVGAIIFIKSDELKGSIEPGVLKIHYPLLTGAVGFIKNKPLSFDGIKITSDQDGVVFLYSTDNRPIDRSDRVVLAMLGGVKNQSSGWKNGKFDWGASPASLKKLNVAVRLGFGKKFKIYELGPDGKRGKEIVATFENKAIFFSTKSSCSPWFEIIAE